MVLRVYARGAQEWAEIERDTDYGDCSYGAGFAPNGRLAITSLDGQVRLYSAGFKLISKVQATGGKQPLGIAFSADGTRLAVGYADTIAVSLPRRARPRLAAGAGHRRPLQGPPC